MSMFPSQDPKLARAIIEERHRAADKARLARQARQARIAARAAHPAPAKRRFGAARWVGRVALFVVRPLSRRNADAEPSPGR
jgi:hypothetical protein